MPTFVTSRPPTIPSSVAHDNSFSRIVKADKLEVDNLVFSTDKAGTAVMGDVGVTGRTSVPGTTAITYVDIKENDLVFVTLKALGTPAAVMGVAYTTEFVPFADPVAAHFVITSVDAASVGPIATDDTTVQFMVTKVLL